ncbi:uncharacterized protein AMSG_10556 [Thecamonas trahens ATCC 50062]|uniref:Uncharacterized protein n=1 Tax=Thecamonas trahens ATCC 50062 TaxID=461836 RepID=A0A0L0DRI6_THETB|nr:hypothetical protein AMSG_10556 [Thecamonas trahens ATCC 50062]KNC54900.1 hypothetical protein AMSG_10556 [Thecamonas trahens ATCC 50062]|eukprot:XP_013753491.1 hypothetical protein AMSG_10556 [Thecamonas trahens ATCC 50062]
MILRRTREHNGLAVPEANARFAALTTDWAAPHIDRYLETAMGPDRSEFLDVFNAIKAYTSSASRHEYGSECSLDDCGYNASIESNMAATPARIAAKTATLAPPQSSLASQQAERAGRAELAALRAASHLDGESGGGTGAGGKTPGTDQAGDESIGLVSLYQRDFHDWSARGMASKVHRDRKLDWGADQAAPFAATLERADEAEFFRATNYTSVYQETLSLPRAAVVAASDTLPPEEIVHFYAGDVLRASLVADVAEWYAALSERSQDSFKDVMRRFTDFLKRTTTAAGHDWRTFASGERSKMAVSRHAYESSRSLVNASVGRERPKLKADRLAADATRRANAARLDSEADAAAIRAAAESATGGATYTKPTIDARRGTSLASEGYGRVDGPSAHLLDTTYQLSYANDDTRRSNPPLPLNSYHHKPSSIPDMIIGQKTDHDALVSSYNKAYVNKHQRAREYRAKAVTQTNQWNAQTYM